MAELENIDISLNIKSNRADKTVRELKNEIRELTSLLPTLNEGSEEYNETLQKIAQSSQLVTNTTNDVRAVTQNWSQTLGQVSGSLSLVTAGMNAYKSVAILTGRENDDLAKTFVQLQAISSLTQTLNQLQRGATSAQRAFRVLNNVMRANPAIAVTSAIGALVSALVLFNRETETAEERQERLKTSTDKLKESLERQNDEIEYQIRLLKAQGQAEEDINNFRLQQAVKTTEQLESELAKQREDLEYHESQRYSIFQTRGRNTVNQLRKEIEITEKLIEDNQKVVSKIEQDAEIIRTQNRTKAIDNQRKQINDFYNAELRAREQFNKLLFQEEQNAYNQQYNLLETNAERLASVQQRIYEQEYDIRLRLLRDLSEDENFTEQQRLSFRHEFNELQAEFISLSNTELNLNRAIAEQTQQLIELNNELELAKNPQELSLEQQAEQHQLEIQRIQEILDTETISTEQRIELTNDLIEAYLLYGDVRRKLDEEDEKQSQEIIKRRVAELNATSGVLGAIANLWENTTNEYKAFAVTSATISTLAGAVQALNDNTVPNFYVRLANFATTLTTGFGTVKSILSTNKNNTEIPSTSTINQTPYYPDFNIPINESFETTQGNEMDVLNERTVLVVDDFNKVNNRVMSEDVETTFGG